MRAFDIFLLDEQNKHASGEAAKNAARDAKRAQIKQDTADILAWMLNQLGGAFDVDLSDQNAQVHHLEKKRFRFGVTFPEKDTRVILRNRLMIDADSRDVTVETLPDKAGQVWSIHKPKRKKHKEVDNFGRAVVLAHHEQG